MFLTKRPDVYPNWDDPESDEEEVPSDVFFGMKVNVKVESIDSLKKSSGLLVANMTPDQPSEYRLTIYRYAIIVSFSKYR